jgi:hypothetical protein
VEDFIQTLIEIGGVNPAAGAGPTTKKDIQDLPAGFL